MAPTCQLLFYIILIKAYVLTFLKDIKCSDTNVVHIILLWYN